MAEGDTTSLYAFVYNYTSGYFGVVDVSWALSAGIGTLSPATGRWSLLNATQKGLGNITVSYVAFGILATNKTQVVVGDETPPDPPTNLLIEVLGNGKVRLTWNPSQSPDVAGYLVYRTTTPEDQDSWVSVTTDPISGNSFVDEGLDPNTEYFYWAVAVDDAEPDPNLSDYSDMVSAVPNQDEADLVFWIILIILVVVIILLIIFYMMKQRGKKEDSLSEQTESDKS
jgi:hypothetical protein